MLWEAESGSQIRDALVKLSPLPADLSLLLLELAQSSTLVGRQRCAGEPVAVPSIDVPAKRKDALLILGALI